MACVWMDGFEIDFADNTAGLWDNLTRNTTTVAITATNARTGNGCLSFSSASTTYESMLYKTLASSASELYFGFSFRIDSSNTYDFNGTDGIIFTTSSATGTTQVQMRVNKTTRVLSVTRNGTLLGTGTATISDDTTYYIETRIVIHDTTGVVQVKVDGTLDIDLSSQDTDDTNGASANIATFGIGQFTNIKGLFYFDDFICNDTSGSVSNSWPNGAGIELLTPSADGNYTAWTSTGGAVDYTEIDDWSSFGGLSDGATTTILSQTTDQRTSVALTNTTLVGSVQAVMLLASAWSDGAAVDQMAQSVRLSSTDYDSTAFAPPATEAIHTDILTLNPGTTAQWTTSEIDGMEYGVRRIT